MLMNRLYSGHQRAEEVDPDAALLRVLRADPDALAKLYADYYPRLHSFLMRVLRQPADVEEIINDTMLVVWNKADQFAGRSRVSTWIYGIAYKMALKRLHRNKRRAAVELGPQEWSAPPRDPAAVINDKAILAEVRLAVAGLPLAQRTIVHLAMFYGYGYPEIAEIVGCPLGTVKTRMFYARDRLRPLLDRLADQQAGAELL